MINSTTKTIKVRSIKEVINSQTVDDSELIKVVSEYIQERKGAAVNIDLAANNPAPNRVILEMHIATQLQKLFKAYKFASDYYIKKYAAEEKRKSEEAKAKEPSNHSGED